MFSFSQEPEVYGHAGKETKVINITIFYLR